MEMKIFLENFISLEKAGFILNTEGPWVKKSVLLGANEALIVRSSFRTRDKFEGIWKKSCNAIN